LGFEKPFLTFQEQYEHYQGFILSGYYKYYKGVMVYFSVNRHRAAAGVWL
jgi:hypothetical protein